MASTPRSNISYHYTPLLEPWPQSARESSLCANSRQAVTFLKRWIGTFDGTKHKHSDHADFQVAALGKSILELKITLQQLYSIAQEKGGWIGLCGEGVSKILIDRLVYFLQLTCCCGAELVTSSIGNEQFQEAKAALGILSLLLAFHERLIIRAYYETALPVCLARMLLPVEGFDKTSDMLLLLGGVLGEILRPVQSKVVELLVRMCEVGGPTYTSLLLLPDGSSSSKVPRLLTRVLLIVVAACHSAVSNRADNDTHYDLIARGMHLVRILFMSESTVSLDDTLLTIEGLTACWDVCADYSRTKSDYAEGCTLALRELLSSITLILPVILERHHPIFATTILPRAVAILYETTCFRCGILARSMLKMTAIKDGEEVEVALRGHPQWLGGFPSRQDYILSRLGYLNTTLLMKFVDANSEFLGERGEGESMDPHEFLQRHGGTLLADAFGSRRDKSKATPGDILPPLRWSLACDMIELDSSIGLKLIEQHYLVEEILIVLIETIVMTDRGMRSPNAVAAVKFIRRLTAGIAKERISRALHGLPDQFTESILLPRDTANDDDIPWSQLTLQQLFQFTHNIRCNVLGIDGRKWEKDAAPTFFEWTNREAEDFLTTSICQEQRSTHPNGGIFMNNWDKADLMERALMKYKKRLISEENGPRQSTEHGTPSSKPWAPKERHAGMDIPTRLFDDKSEFKAIRQWSRLWKRKCLRASWRNSISAMNKERSPTST